jgi:hypothetical protein
MRRTRDRNDGRNKKILSQQNGNCYHEPWGLRLGVARISVEPQLLGPPGYLISIP